MGKKSNLINLLLPYTTLQIFDFNIKNHKKKNSELKIPDNQQENDVDQWDLNVHGSVS